MPKRKSIASLKKLLSDFRKAHPYVDVNDKLRRKLKPIVNDLIRKDAREEAMEILSKSNREIIGNFMYYYYSNMKNSACMELDRAKGILVKKKIMKQGKNDSFKGFKL